MAIKSILSMNAFDQADFDSLPEDVKPETRRRLDVFGSASVLFFQEPIEMVKGEGCYLIDSKNTRYLDCYNNVACIGHGNPRVAEYVSRQLLKVNHHTRYLNSYVDDYCEKLLSRFPEPLNKIAMTCSGSESNDLALRAAFYYTGGKGIIVTSGAYHGNTYLVTYASPSSTNGKVLCDFVETVPAPDTYRVPADKLAEVFAQDVEKACQRLEAKGIKVAALLFDDIFSSDGVFSDPKGFIKKAIDVVHKHGGLYIADEVQPGFGRTGKMWGFERHDVIPDIVTMGKPMGNGYPMSAMVTRPEIIDALKGTGYFNTFGGSPGACAAGTAVLEVLDEEGLIANAIDAGDYLREGLRDLASDHPCIGDVRGTGLFTGLEVVKDRDTKEVDSEGATLLINRLRYHNVLIGAAGPHGNILKIRPPLTFYRKDADFFIDAIKGALKDINL
ncbi:MAG: aspartate aminotransferase family protein [Succinivibrio sp.]